MPRLGIARGRSDESLESSACVLEIARSVFDQMIAHAQRELPIEACGYLAKKGRIVVRHYPLKNMDGSGTHFSFNPQDQFEAVRDMRSLGLKPAVVYHSHPTTPARASQEDIRLAKDPAMNYVIISLSGDSPKVVVFRIRENRVELGVVRVIDDAHIC